MSDTDLDARITEIEQRLTQLEQLVASTCTVLDGREVENDTTEVEMDRESERATIRRAVIETITHFEQAYGESPPIDSVVEELADQGHDTDDVQTVIDALQRDGLVYEPHPEHVRVA